MRVLCVFIVVMRLLCTVDGGHWPISTINNFKYIQRIITNNNHGKYEENCLKHCNCYTTNLVKVKCDRRMIPQMSDWKIQPRYMLVC